MEDGTILDASLSSSGDYFYSRAAQFARLWGSAAWWSSGPSPAWIEVDIGLTRVSGLVMQGTFFYVWGTYYENWVSSFYLSTRSVSQGPLMEITDTTTGNRKVGTCVKGTRVP